MRRRNSTRFRFLNVLFRNAVSLRGKPKLEHLCSGKTAFGRLFEAGTKPAIPKKYPTARQPNTRPAAMTDTMTTSHKPIFISQCCNFGTLSIGNQLIVCQNNSTGRSSDRPVVYYHCVGAILVQHRLTRTIEHCTEELRKVIKRE